MRSDLHLQAIHKPILDLFHNGAFAIRFGTTTANDITFSGRLKPAPAVSSKEQSRLVRDTKPESHLFDQPQNFPRAMRFRSQW